MVIFGRKFVEEGDGAGVGEHDAFHDGVMIHFLGEICVAAVCEVGVQGVSAPGCCQEQRGAHDSEVAGTILPLEVVSDEVGHVALAHPVQQVDAVGVDSVLHQHDHLFFATAFVRIFLKSAQKHGKECWHWGA